MGLEVIVVGVALCVTAGVVGPAQIRAKAAERERLYDLLSKAQERGQPISPELLRELAVVDRGIGTRERDIRRGVLLLAISLGLSLSAGAFWVAYGWQRGWDHGVFSLAVPAIVLFCVGLSFLGLGLTARRNEA